MTTEEIRAAALAASARVHGGVGAGTGTVIRAAVVFEEYIREGKRSGY